MVDVVGRTGEALIKYVDFVAEVTGAPILVDSPSKDARLEACRHAIEVGLRERIIYNSINPDSPSGEIDALRELGVESAVLLAFSEYEFSPEEKLRILKTEKTLFFQRLRGPASEKCSWTSRCLTWRVWLSAAAIRKVKDDLGLPSGCSPANAFDAWRRVKELAPQAKRTCLASLCVFTQCFGANFILYGPMKFADAVFPACAMADAILTYSLVIEGKEPEDRNTPLYKIF